VGKLMAGSGERFNGIALGAIATGCVFIYAGIKGYSIPETIKKLIQGQSPAGQVQTTGLNATAGGTAATSTSSNTGAQGGSASANQAIAQQLAAAYGWSTGANWSALVSLWNSESGWSNTIWNTSASCGNDAYAYGIPQACGHGVQGNTGGHGSWCPFPSGNQGNPPACGGTSDAGAQISWGLAYIKANYGEPVNVPHGGY